MPVIFLSYRREDAAGYAGRLRESLEERFGEGRVFRDVDTLEPGQDFVQAIEQRVSQCTAFLALLGREWLEATDSSGRLRLQQPDDYVRREIAAALARPHLLVIPVLVEGVSMPPSTELPEDIRSLARRHAVTLRDETWSHDVDRLASAISRAVDQPGSESSGRPQKKPRPWTRNAGVAAVAVVIIALGIVLPQLRGTNATNAADPTDPGGGGATLPIEMEDRGVSFKIEVPRVAEFEIDEHVYTLLWASLTPRGETNTLRLRFRFSNEGRLGANFSSDAFRLDLGEQVLTASDGPGLVVAGVSIEHGMVVFDVPAGARSGVLQILESETAQLALDLSGEGVLTSADTADPGDALSRAIVLALPVDEPEMLLRSGAGEFTLMRASARRFINKLRIVFSIRLMNTTPAGQYFGTDDFRLDVGGELRAPVAGPAEGVPGNSSSFADYVFEVPPETRRVTLRILTEGRSPVERSFDIPSRT